MEIDRHIEDLLRELAPGVLGSLIRRHGQFDSCEDAVQDALLDAATQWPEQGVPDNARGWLITVASRRLMDQWRSEQARRRREDAVALQAPPEDAFTNAVDEYSPTDEDDTLKLLFLCCQPELSPSSQLALTLRAVGGLTTAQIAQAFFVPEATMAQRISRAKQRIKATGTQFQMPQEPEWSQRFQVVLQVLYLIFNEGYIATSGAQLDRVELTTEAIRLARLVRRLLPEDGEVAGLLALMLLTDARRPARVTSSGSLIPLEEQDRSLWNAAFISEGVALVSHALAHFPAGPYQLQAAIAAVHDEASDVKDTDWPQIVELYRLLENIAPNPMVTLNHAVALAMVKGPQAGLDLASTLDTDDRLKGHHRLDAVRAHLWEMAGEYELARSAYRVAARRTDSLPEQHYLELKAARLAEKL